MPEPNKKDKLKIFKISENPINLTEITESVLSAECGADVTFVGRVRNQDSQKQVIKLIYEAHPEASKQIMEISKIISKLLDADLPSGRQKIKFDSDGEVTGNYDIYQVVLGKFVLQRLNDKS